MTSKHPVEQDELMAYLDGELDANRAAAAVAHLERCAECQIFADEIREVSRDLMVWEIETRDAKMPAKVAEAFEREQRRQAQKPMWLPISTPTVMARRLSWVGAFAILCAVAGLILKFGSPNRTPMRQMVNLSEPKVQFGPKTRSVPELANPVTTTLPGIAGDSNGILHGLGDHAANSFSVDRQSASQQASPFSNKLPVSAPLQNPPNTGPMIVRTAGITLTTSDFDNARGALDEILKRRRGYIGELTLSTPIGSGRGLTATLRVPADQLDDTLADLRKLGRVESESQSGQEVTAQYVDLEARLSNARNTESRLTDLLRQRTGKLSDVLAFEKEIDRVRGQIESMEAEKKSLANQIDMAAISVNVAENYRAPLQIAPVSTSRQIRNAAVEGYRTMVEGIVGVVLFLMSYGPSFLLWGGILFFPARFVWRKLRP